MIENNNIKVAVAPEEVKQVGLVGTGIIGSAWAAHFLACGLDVIATDPNPAAEKNLRRGVDKAWFSLEQLGLAKYASRDRLSFTTSIDTALNDADFIQESTPENNDIKDKVMAAISEAARPNVVIASSTSGIVPTRLQAHCKNPQRMIVGHPFNPVYLIPLVEVVGGKQTAPETVRWAIEFYQHWGKTPLHCRTETPGHLANRLQDALSNEAMHLITGGIATTDEVDAALTAGPGLRWALIGSVMTEHLAAGEGGLRDTLTGKFDADVSSPDLSKVLVDRIVAENQSQVAGRSLKQIEQMRDEFLVGLLKLRANIEAKYGFNQGRFLSDRINKR